MHKRLKKKRQPASRVSHWRSKTLPWTVNCFDVYVPILPTVVKFFLGYVRLG